VPARSGRPTILERLLERLAEAGITRGVLVTGYLATASKSISRSTHRHSKFPSHPIRITRPRTTW
jgi:choline kinase